ncbi:MAG: hypothetical protein ACXVNM_10430 [Bacteroidia bacterium]
MKTYNFVFLVALISLASCNRQREVAKQSAVATLHENNSVEAKKVITYWWNVTTYQDFRVAYLRSSGKGC